MFVRTSKSTEVPEISLEKCEYDKTRRVLKLSSEYFGMPVTFDVRSHHTGKTIRFFPVSLGDPLFDEDQWDGEQRIYRPVSPTSGVDYMVIYHQW